LLFLWEKRFIKINKMQYDKKTMLLSKVNKEIMQTKPSLHQLSYVAVENSSKTIGGVK
jgi:hypothetical protein